MMEGSSAGTCQKHTILVETNETRTTVISRNKVMEHHAAERERLVDVSFESPEWAALAARLRPSKCSARRSSIMEPSGR